MPLLEHGEVAADRFVAVDDASALPEGVPALIPLARLRSEGEVLAGRNAPLGVVADTATRPEELADLLPWLALVAVRFPKFRDGRGFTLARTLRERFGFAGEIRAIGHVLPDQHAFLLRCGFSSVAVPEGADLAPWTAALGRFHMAYQADVAENGSRTPFRHRLRLA
jgi:uncharacterized protein (DUF934 family)